MGEEYYDEIASHVPRLEDYESIESVEYTKNKDSNISNKSQYSDKSHLTHIISQDVEEEQKSGILTSAIDRSKTFFKKFKPVISKNPLTLVKQSSGEAV
jgi:type IV secretory pathway VirB6-like protein